MKKYITFDRLVSLFYKILFAYFAISMINMGITSKPMWTSKSLTYDQLPYQYKLLIYEFEQTAYKHNVDVSKVRTINYSLINKQNWGLLGFYNLATNTLHLNTAYPLNVVKEVLWHELGHGILYYSHDTRKGSTHLMATKYDGDKVAWEIKKEQFFTEPIKWKISYDWDNGLFYNLKTFAKTTNMK